MLTKLVARLLLADPYLAALVLMLCAAMPRATMSQAPQASAREGDRVRIQRYDARHPRIGRLIARSDDSITVEWLAGARESMPTFEVEQMDVSVGHSHYVERGAAYGVAIGGTIGYAIKKFIDHDKRDDVSSKSATGTNAMLVALGGGAVFGALTGALGTEGWRPVPLSARRGRVGFVMPVRRRDVGLGMSATF